jgi:hypothetical protein
LFGYGRLVREIVPEFVFPDRQILDVGIRSIKTRFFLFRQLWGSVSVSVFMYAEVLRQIGAILSTTENATDVLDKVP